MSFYIEQKLTRLIANALEATKILREGEVPYSDVRDRNLVFRSTQKPGLLITAENGKVYELRIKESLHSSSSINDTDELNETV